MDPSHNFPPSPREMYMYQPAQRVNGHKVSPSPTRGRPPPVLPERKPETQLSHRASRPSLSSLDSASFDVASPPHSPGSQGHKPPHLGQSNYADNKPFSYAAAINSPQPPHKRGAHDHEDHTRVQLHRDQSPRGQRGSVGGQGHVDIQRYAHPEDHASQNTATIYQRIDRNRTVSTPDNMLSGGYDCYDSDSGHTYDSFGQSEAIYGQFVQPSNGSHHRPSLTYVPPPVVPVLPEIGKVDTPVVRNQHSHLQEHQQPKVVSKNSLPSMSLDAASPHNHHAQHHHHKHHHHHHHTLQQHDQSQVVTRHHSHRSPASSSSPVVSPKRTNSARMKAKPDKLPQPPSIPVPPPPPPPPPSPAPLHDKHASVVTNTRTPSPPLPPPPFEPGFSSRHRSSKKRIEPPCPPSPLTSHSKNADTQLCMSGPALHHHHHQQQHQHYHQQHPLVDSQPTDLPPHNHHQVKAPAAQTPPPPPPPPPVRISSTPQLLSNHHSDLISTPSGVRSPRSGSPARHHVQRQTSLATIDDLAQIRLRTVGDSTPSSPVLSPVAASDISSGAINVKLRPTPGKFRNIYAEDETTLPPPPPLDDLDELPPPPPPPELLGGDLANPSFSNTTHQKQANTATPTTHPNQLHCPPGEADSLHIDHRLVQQQAVPRQAVSTSKTHTPDSAGNKAGAGSSSRTLENIPSSLGQLISETVSSMDFDIPDDIDLSQCPGLVEINKSTPNWKKDMIEKKNQEKIEEYVKAILKEREQQAKWKNVPEWKRKILQKKEEEDATAATVVSQPAETKIAVGKKPGKKAPVPPPKETKEDSAQPKPKGDIVPAALSIDPEELAAMPPWKQELLFKRGKVPVTFSNEFNPDEEEKADNESVPAS